MTRQDVMNYLANASVLELTELQSFIQETINENSLSEYRRLEMQLAEFKKRTNVKVPKIKGEPKYFNPKNPSENWSGKGNPPKWFRDNVDSGMSKESMEITK